ncbi:Mannosylfructose-phosphate synthase [Actinomyces bovis]|uniref:Mannosylfructose-phosphate synthase n=1 Tax=Actinomyces bovis TaxID=1658 RepID=A0ABY1VMY8_9ACTO|nr:glycosyltransferase family 1 protein [Actinomyces bovis]SPT53304.1 Mannosylfructose-phosphate synthase [Actinomyces bovis]VEG52622.1 Mannosylfructose-phosphate synthase [Actinomyces israelii]
MSKTAPLPDRSPKVALVIEQLWQPVPGGSGTYIVELAQALHAQGARLAGLAARHQPSPTTVDLGLPRLPVRYSLLPRTALYESWNWLGLPRAESVVPGAQVVHATTWAVPGTRLPLAVTVHDLAFLRSPEHFTRRGNTYFKRSLERTRQEARVVITPSRATADDCVREGIPASRIEVIPHGVRTLPVEEAAVARFRAAHGLQREYVLWTGTREPRKNLPTLLRAFSLLSPQHPDLDLVLVGPQGWGSDAQEQELLRELPGRVHVLGRLPQEELAAAYRGARVFAFPSLWEGFGLPVLEAMAYGTPVVTSAGTCLEEVCGEAGLLAAPQDPAALATQLDRAAGAEHDALAQAGLVRAQGFTWQASAAAHLEVYRSLAAGERR